MSEVTRMGNAAIATEKLYRFTYAWEHPAFEGETTEIEAADEREALELARRRVIESVGLRLVSVEPTGWTRAAWQGVR